MSLLCETFYDQDTFTLTYIVHDANTKDAVIIDPVLDYDPASSKISYESIEKLLKFVGEQKLKVHYILETHAHADHLTGAAELRRRIEGAKVGIGKNITKVQEVFSDFFNLQGFDTTGGQFDVLLNEDQPLQAGTIEVKTIFTPGHTPACSLKICSLRVMLFLCQILELVDVIFLLEVQMIYITLFTKNYISSLIQQESLLVMTINQVEESLSMSPQLEKIRN